MFAIRATAKVLKRGAPKPELEPAQPTTVLGDWYANVLVVRPQHLILAVSERTMLPVVVTAKNVSRLPQRIAQAAQEVLLGIGVEPSLIAREIEEMQVACFAKTENRSLLGGLNDFMFHLEHAYHYHPEFNLHGLAMWLAKTPTGVIKDIFPFKAALQHPKVPQACVVQRVRSNPSLNRRANGRPPGPGWWYTIHSHQPGPGALPLSPG